MWELLRPQIGALLESLSSIEEVAEGPDLDFVGYPAAYVMPSDNSADYETNKENIRTYAFIVRVFYETKKNGITGSLGKLEKVVDSILDIFDQEDLKRVQDRTVAINLPAKYTFINIWAAPSSWGKVQDEELIMAEINVKVRMSVDIS